MLRILQPHLVEERLLGGREVELLGHRCPTCGCTLTDPIKTLRRSRGARPHAAGLWAWTPDGAMRGRWEHMFVRYSCGFTPASLDIGLAGGRGATSAHLDR